MPSPKCVRGSYCVGQDRAWPRALLSGQACAERCCRGRKGKQATLVQ
jgi:hypothetical protein